MADSPFASFLSHSPSFVCPSRCGLPFAVSEFGMERHIEASAVPRHASLLVSLPDMFAHRKAIEHVGGLRKYLGLQNETIFLSMRGPSAFHSVAENPPEDDKTEAIPTIADVATNQPSSTPVLSDSPSPHHEIDGASKKRKRPIEGNGFGRGERKKSTKAAQAAKLLPLSRMPTKVDGMSFDNEGGRVWVTPQEYLQAARQMKPDVVFAMAAETDYAAEKKKMTSVNRSLFWLDKLIALMESEKEDGFSPCLFGVVTGETEDFQRKCLEEILTRKISGVVFSGNGGVESSEIRIRTISSLISLVPPDLPRVAFVHGNAAELVRLATVGVDLFISSFPDECATKGVAFTFFSSDEKTANISFPSSSFLTDFRPLCGGCHCYACTHHTRAYVNHLFATKEILGEILLAIHNRSCYERLFDLLRVAKKENRLKEWSDEFLAKWNGFADNSPKI